MHQSLKNHLPHAITELYQVAHNGWMADQKNNRKPLVQEVHLQDLGSFADCARLSHALHS